MTRLYNLFGKVIYDSQANGVIDTVREAIDHLELLHNIDLYKVYAPGADWSGASMPQADLREANLFGAKLDNSNLKRANARGANFDSASLKGADVAGADLSKACFRNAEMFSCSWPAAFDLQDADFRGALLLRLESVRLPIIFIAPNKIEVGCETKTLPQWRRERKRLRALGKENGYSQSELSLYESHIIYVARTGARLVELLQRRGAHV